MALAAGLLLSACQPGGGPGLPSARVAQITVQSNRDQTVVLADGREVGTGRIVSFVPPAGATEVRVEGRFPECRAPAAASGAVAAGVPTRKVIVPLPLRGDREILWVVEDALCVTATVGNPAWGGERRSNPPVPR